MFWPIVYMHERGGLPRTIGGDRGSLLWLLGRASINLQLLRIVGGHARWLCSRRTISPGWRRLRVAASCPPKDLAWMMTASCGGFLPADLNAWTRLLAFLLFSSQFALISSLWTKMPLKHLFYLKILIYTIQHMECLEIDYKNKVKGALNVNIWSAIRPPNLTFARPRANYKC